MHEVSELLEVLKARPTRHETLDMLRPSAPAHWLLGPDEHPKEWNRETREPVQGPFGPPGAESPEPHRRIELPPPPVGIVTTTHGHQIFEPRVRQTWVHLPAALSEFGDCARTTLVTRRSTPVGKPRGEFRSERASALVLRYVWSWAAIWDAVEVHEGTEPERVRVRERGHDRPALGMADDHDGSAACDMFEDFGGIAEVSIEGVEVGVVGVSVATLIPGDDAEPGGRETRGEDVEGAGEVGPTVDEHQHRVVRSAPFVHRNSDTVGIDPVGALRGDGPGEHSLVDHPGEATTVAVVLGSG